ncbi:MAG: hypothetical protein HY359_16630 [Candidatus Rokubacteria bacterium]|nr:hypothetical protein [Candidatus Rokubacteria bacterium]
MPLRERERRLVEEALAALRRATGLKAAVLAREPKTPKGTGPDAVIEIQTDGKPRRFLAAVQAVDRAVGLATAKHRLEPFGRQGVLVAPYLTAELATHCREKLDLPFIDTAGNAYLRAPGLYVFIRGERPERPVARVMGAPGRGTATALRVVFALLCQPALLTAPYRDIVAAAGVALGAVGWVFFDLQARGYLTGGTRRRDRRWLEPDRLLEEWVTTYPLTLRPKLNPRRFRAPDPAWWQRTRLPDGALWGGEVAAHRLTDYLKPATGTLYLDPAKGRDGVTALVQDHRLRADLKGEVEILDRFWNFPTDPTHPDLVPPLLVYADLMATLDPRNLEVAKRIREEHLGHALRRP